MTLKELTDLYNLKTGKNIKKLPSKAKGIEMISKLQKSKASMIRDMFAEKPSWTRQEIMEQTGFDSNNAHQMMNIFKNPKRYKNLLVTKYDRKTQTYNLVES